MNTAVSARNIYKVFAKVTVVNNLYFEIERGKIFGLLDSSGAGKSTAIRMLITLTKPTQGSIELAG